VTVPARLALATRNTGKVEEILRICRLWPVEWMLATGFGGNPQTWPVIEETGSTYIENAVLKAAGTARALGVAAVADDSGIEVDALGGAPGVRSARFAGPNATDQANLRLLIERVTGVERAARTARYRCVAVCAWPGGRRVEAEGTCEGGLVLEPRGTGGFGYDPIFVPAGEERTMAELSPEEKDAISHRGRAFRALGEALRNG
jgi:XTP/dITP diphosphohydrolase